MKFRVDFNYNTNDSKRLLEDLGCKYQLEEGDHTDGYFYKDLDTLLDLETFQKDVCKVTGNDMYSFVIDFDSPTIFFDDKA